MKKTEIEKNIPELHNKIDEMLDYTTAMDVGMVAVIVPSPGMQDKIPLGFCTNFAPYQGLWYMAQVLCHDEQVDIFKNDRYAKVYENLAKRIIGEFKQKLNLSDEELIEHFIKNSISNLCNR